MTLPHNGGRLAPQDLGMGHLFESIRDAVIVADANGSRRFPVPDYGTAIGDLADRPGFRLGWGRFPGGAEVLYLYDRDDGGFGHAVNLTAPDCSEWGFAPF